MTGVGEFPPAAREAVTNACGGRCAGCGASGPLTIQHRRARGAGGTNVSALGWAANGVLLCGSGTTGCHGWAEAHPDHARALGWRLDRGDDPTRVPFLTSTGWRCWLLDGDDPAVARDWLVAYVDPADLAPERMRGRAALWEWITGGRR